VRDACDVAGERDLRQDFDDHLATLSDEDARRIGQRHVDADLEVLGVVQMDEVR